MSDAVQSLSSDLRSMTSRLALLGAVDDLRAATDGLRRSLKYSPDQARDYHGRFASEGGGAGAAIGRAVGLVASGPKAGDAKLQEWQRTSHHTGVADILAAAPRNQASLREAGTTIAKATGSELVDPGTKSAIGVLDKLPTRGYIPANITDATRAGFKVQTPAQADAVVAKLSQHFPTIDEGWRLTSAGYFDRSLKVQFPDGQIGEVQIWHPDMLAAKEAGGGHDQYKVMQTALRRGDVAGARSAMERQGAIYSAARSGLPDSWKALLGKLGS